METKNVILTCSEGMKPEYCCSVIKIGHLEPVENSDFLVKTDVFGTQIVLRKDVVNEGDIMFYAANETELNHDFLSANNLFEISCRDMNANADEVNAIMNEYVENYQKKTDSLQAKAKKIKNDIKAWTTANKKYEKTIKKRELMLGGEDNDAIQSEIDGLKEKIDNNIKLSYSKTAEYATIKSEIEEIVNSGKHIVEKANKLVGFFNKYGRVRCIKLRGEDSFGYVFNVDEMAKFCPEIKDVNLEDFVGKDFDTVNGELFVKAYVPRVTPSSNKNGNGQKKDKTKRFDRMVEGEFAFHYDTSQLEKNMHTISPDDRVICSVKLHGTSVIIAKVRVKVPKKIALYKTVWNWFVDTFNVCRNSRFIDYYIEYGPVYSTRRVIKNKYINKDVKGGYYDIDFYSMWGDIIYPYLSDGMTVYGEIVGYANGTDKSIQKFYDYGCKVGESKFMPYRITTTDYDGNKYEWEANDVKFWTDLLINYMKNDNNEAYKFVHPLDILYDGTLADLYPNVDEDTHWHENILQEMKKDKEHFGMEELEPLCTENEVPREGICVRIFGDKQQRAFKLKTSAFKYKEAIQMDNGEVDIEMLDNYVENQ